MAALPYAFAAAPVATPVAPAAAPSGHARGRWRGTSSATSTAVALLCAASRNVPSRPRQTRRVVVRAVTQAICEALREDLSAVLEDPLQGSRQVPRLLQEAIDRLNDEGDGNDGREAAECVTLALEMLLEVKAFQEAAKLYLEWKREVQIPISSRVEMLKILGSFGNFQPAANHVRELLEAEDIDTTEAAELFDGILFGIVQAHHPLSSSRADVLIQEMLDIGLRPTDETMRLIVEAKTLFAAPGFLIDLGQSVLEIIRRCDTTLKSSTLLAISGAHLRTGDLDAAYRWFLASQLMTDRQTLNDGPTLELVSQLARALAIGGRACQLKRLLERVKEDGGELPSNAAAVSLSGYSCGRSMATCWLEPPSEVVRRRGLWSSTPTAQREGAARVTCAEQWDWQQQETSRQEMYQWYPYMSPETKLERAWITPLRSIDRGALGLSCQWAGQTPAEASARERLQESTASQPFDLEAALSLEPPRLSHRRGKVTGSPVVLCPEPRTWRMYHADAVKKAYPTAQRTSVGSPAELRELLLAEKKTRLMFGAKPVAHPIPHSTIEAWISEADETTLAKLRKTKDIETMTNQQLIDRIAAISGMSPEEIEEDPKLNPSRLRHILETALGFANGNASVPMTDEEYTEKILAMTDDELHEAFLNLKSSINDSIMGSDLSQQVERKLLQERDEDSSSWDGSAADELRLALDICEALQDMGFTGLSKADQRALLSAAHALGDAALAAEVLEMQDLPADVASATTSELGQAQESLWRAMVKGGWDSETTKDFLQGKRLLPLRDDQSELGKLQTKYLDPLQGLASATDASPDELLAKLSKPFSGRLKPFVSRKLQSGVQSREDRMKIMKDEDDALSSVQWEIKVPDPEDPSIKVTKLMQVTRSDVLEAQLLHPASCELLQRLSSSPRLSKQSVSYTPELGKIVMEIGLPVPSRQERKNELLSFVISVLRSSQLWVRSL
eukprot:s558_g23.t1